MAELLKTPPTLILPDIEDIEDEKIKRVCEEYNKALEEFVTAVYSDISLLYGTSGFISGAKGYKSASDQTIAHNTTTKVVLDGEEFDVLEEFDPITNYRFTTTVAGYYLFIGSCYYFPTVDQKVYTCRIHKNNVVYQVGAITSSGTGDIIIPSIGIVKLSVNDYLELYTYQNSGGNATLIKGKEVTFLTVKRLC